MSIDRGMDKEGIVFVGIHTHTHTHTHTCPVLSRSVMSNSLQSHGP